MIETIEREQHKGIHLKRSIRTVAKRKGEWLENVKANAPRIVRDGSELWLDSNYPEMISVAAGPSLSEDFEALLRLRPNREVVAVDAALKFCLDNGLEPDYAVVTDASDKILPMIKDLGPIKTKLLLNVVAHPSIAPNWPGEVYWFVMANQFYDLDHKAMIQDMHSLTSKVGLKIVPGGNVSSIALGFALGVRNADKLFLFGHDFCWKKSMYCGGYMPDLAEERIASELRSGTIYKEKNTRGDSIFTNLSLMQFAKWHSDVIGCGRSRVVNCTSSTILTF